MRKRPSTERSRPSVFIVDDHPIFREGLGQLLQDELGVNVCGQAAQAVEALEKLLQLPCNLAIVDVALPGRSGIELARDIHAMRPQTAVLVVSAYDELLYAERALRSHARGYIMKLETPIRIIHAVRTILAGGAWFSEKISAKLFDIIAGRGPSKGCHSIQRLTDRELEILKLIGDGKRNKDIAQELHLSPKTVDVHRCHIRDKLGLNSGVELVCYATRWADAAVGSSWVDQSSTKITNTPLPLSVAFEGTPLDAGTLSIEKGSRSRPPKESTIPKTTSRVGP